MGVHFLGVRYQCHDCGRSYKNKNHLTRHVRQDHSSALPQFRCPYCSRYFKQKYTRDRHTLNFCRSRSWTVRSVLYHLFQVIPVLCWQLTEDISGGEHRLVVARGRQRCRICCETVKNKMDGNAKLTHLTCPPCNKYYCVHCFYLMHQSPLSFMWNLSTCNITFAAISIFIIEGPVKYTDYKFSTPWFSQLICFRV
jgi:DNA-directed RNA polymerase subunit RPC12/RpoP